MTKYTVYQIQVTEEMRNRLNAAGSWSALEEPGMESWKTKQDLTVYGSKKWDNTMWAHFSKVAEVTATDLEEVFFLTNMWTNEAAVNVLADAMHSTSVGDIVSDGKQCWLVDTFGFNEINVPEGQ